MTNSTNSVRLRLRSAPGPQAKLIWRLRTLTSVGVSGSASFGRFNHQTLSPLASTSLIWRSFLPPLPLRRAVKSKRVGQSIGSARRITA